MVFCMLKGVSLSLDILWNECGYDWEILYMIDLRDWVVILIWIIKLIVCVTYEDLDMSRDLHCEWEKYLN